MAIADKLQTVAENLQRVNDLNAELEQTLYGTDTGGKSYYDEFWDEYQSEGRRTNYRGAFGKMGWTKNLFRPKYDMIVKLGGEMFRDNSNGDTFDAYDLVEHLNECGVTLDFSQNTDWSTVFHYSCFSRVGVLDFKSATSTLAYSIGTASYLETIDKIISYENTNYVSTTFNGAKNLKNVVFEGVIAKGTLDLHWSTLLSKESITSIINALSTTTTGLSVTLSQTAVNNAFTTDEWNALIATKTNWTISLA